MKLSGWGRYPALDCEVSPLRGPDGLEALFARGGSWIARGAGRAYGDAALNPDLTVSMLDMNRLRAFDPRTDVLECEAGVLLADILEIFVPRGWFPPVVPGTKFVTVGGMIAAAELVMRTNYTAPALLMGALAERFARRGEGTLVGVSSVAGDRGRASNYVYGSAKAGFTAFLSGLRNRLAKTGVHAATVKPGFVRTRMTDGLRLPPILTAEADEAAAAAVAAIRRKRDVLYVRPIWRPIMAVIACIPERMFKRLRP